MLPGSADIALGRILPSPVDINVLYCCYGHTSTILLKATAKQMVVTFEGDFRMCVECSMSKEVHKPILSKTGTHPTKELDGVFMNLSDVKSVPAPGHEQYNIVVRHDYYRYR